MARQGKRAATTPARSGFEKQVGGVIVSKFERPRQIIDYCLKPLALDETSEAYKETVRRLEHVVKTFQLAAGRDNAPVAVDFSDMRTLTINETAHGHD
jgi:hypothetical protein